MTPERPLLTIAIPTYNRSSCLRELLDSLLPQLADESRVELIVSDNASEDDTQAVLDSFEAGGARFSRNRNTRNLGADGNIHHCFESASGTYVWIVGDDDIVLPGGVGMVVELLSAGVYDLVYVASRPFTGQYQARPAGQSRVAEVLTTPVAFARKAHIALTFISGNIVNKERLLARGRFDFSELIGTSLVQLGWTYAALRTLKFGLYVPTPVVASRQDNSGGYALCQVFGVQLRRITEQWLDDPAVGEIILNSSVQRFFPRFLLKMNSDSHGYQAEDAHAILGPVFGSNFRYWIFDYPVIKLPSVLAAVWFVLSKSLLRLDTYVGSPVFG